MGPPSDDRDGSEDQEQEALLPARPAARARQAARLVPPADLDDDQPRDLGRHVARRPHQPAAASDARLAPLGGAADHHRRRGAFVVRASATASSPPTCRPTRRARTACSRGKTCSRWPRRTPRPRRAATPDEPQAEPASIAEAFERSGRRYRAAVPILPASNRPVYVAGLRPRPGATTIPLGESSDRLLGVEGRVGRGRILVLSVNPSDPALAAWPGLDTLVRRVVLRRPEETRTSPMRWNGRSYSPPTYRSLGGPDLSWVRYLSRDVGTSASPSARSESADPGEFGERAPAPRASISPRDAARRARPVAAAVLSSPGGRVVG